MEKRGHTWYQSTLPQAAVPKVAAAPTIDGAIDETEWQYATSFTGLIGLKDPYVLPEPIQGRVWVAYDDRHFYVALRSAMPPTAREGQSPLRTQSDEHDQANKLEGGDHWELRLFVGEKEQDRTYLWYLAANGAFSDQRLLPEHKGTPRHQAGLEWESEATVAVGETPAHWDLEVAIPLANLGYPDGVPDGTIWQAMFVRARGYLSMDRAAGEWNGAKSFFGRGQAGYLLFDGALPAFQLRETGPLREGEAGPATEARAKGIAKPVVHLANPAATAQPVNLRLAMVSGAELLAEESMTVMLGAGESRRLAFDFAWTYPEARSARLEVEASAGDDHLYSQMIQTNPMSAEQYRTIAHWPYGTWPYPSPWQGVWSLHCANYPYFQSVDVWLATHYNYLPEAVRTAPACAVVLTDAAGKEWRRDRLDIVAGEARAHWPELDLPVGSYILTGQLLDAAGQAVGPPVRREFVRERFAWERNDIGTSNEVFAPFTPIRTDARAGTMQPWGRVYGIGALALPGAIVTTAEQALPNREIAGAMRLRAIRGDTETPFTGAAEVVSAEPGIVRLRGRGEAAGLAASVESFMQYDGWYQVTLKVTAAAPVAVDRLELVWPLGHYPDTIWSYRERSSVYAGGRAPDQGLIWDNLKPHKGKLVNAFTPVIALGDGDHAAWFYADSDEGWRLDYAKASQQLVRTADGLELRLLLVNAPATIEGEVSATFAINTNPCKPDPPNRRFLLWGGHGRIHDTSGYAYWGSGVDAITPGEDGYDRLAGAVQRWADKNRPRIAEGIAKWSGRTDAPLHPIVLYNSGELIGPAMEEWPTFSGEWSGESGMEVIPEYADNDVHATVDWGRGEIKQDWRSQPRALGPVRADLVQSCVDCRIWHYRNNMLNVGINGYWFDNASIWPGDRSATERAYRTPDGDLRPGYPTFNRRELFRRLFVLYKEAGREPWVLIHNHTTWEFAQWIWGIEGDCYVYRHGGDLFETLSKRRHYDIISRIVEVEPTPLDPVARFRAHFRMRRVPGAIVSNMSYRDEGHLHGGRSVIGLSLLHDFGTEGGVYQPLLDAVRGILREFGFFSNDAIAFIPYWRADKLADFDQELTLVSCYRNPDNGDVLCVLVHPGTEDAKGTLALTVDGAGEFIEAESGETLPHRRDGAKVLVESTVPAREFRLLWWRAAR